MSEAIGRDYPNRRSAADALTIYTNLRALFAQHADPMFADHNHPRAPYLYDRPEAGVIDALHAALPNNPSPVIAIPMGYSAAYPTYCWGQGWSVRLQVAGKLGDGYRDFCGLGRSKISTTNMGDWLSVLDPCTAFIIDGRTMPQADFEYLLRRDTRATMLAKTQPGGVVIVRYRDRQAGQVHSPLPKEEFEFPTTTLQIIRHKAGMGHAA